jgi:hypothetical protein
VRQRRARLASSESIAALLSVDAVAKRLRKIEARAAFATVGQ